MTHSIHRVLVPISDSTLGRITDRDTIVSEADEALKEFYMQAYDYLYCIEDDELSEEDLNIGYSHGVLLGCEYPDAIISELQLAKKNQLASIDWINGMLKEIDVNALLKNRIDSYRKGDEYTYSTDLYHLAELTALLRGKYIFESEFYDTEDYTAIVNIDKVKANPEDYAIVLFNLHC